MGRIKLFIQKKKLWFLLSFVIMLILSLVTAFYDDAYRQLYYTGIWYKDILGLLEYWFLWALPFWWIIIVVGTCVLTMIFWVLKFLFANNWTNKN